MLDECEEILTGPTRGRLEEIQTEKGDLGIGAHDLQTRLPAQLHLA